MKAKLNSGEVVELEKDCGCITHDGPHWLHVDDLDKEINKKMLAKAIQNNDYILADSFMQDEIRRLSRKMAEFNQRNIQEILR